MSDPAPESGIATMGMPLLEVRHLTKRFPVGALVGSRQVHAVEDVSFSVARGDSEEIMGHPAHPYTQLLLSAVPDPHAGLRTRKEFVARGEVPSLIDPLPGCPFAARCGKAMDVCRQAMPGQTNISAGHWARCYLYS